MKKIIILCWLLVSVFVTKAQTGDKQYVLLVSFDGFRHDYVEKYNAVHFKQFIAHGIAAKSMISTYPSKTFANHYSIITGLHAGNHGLVDNLFYDPDLQLTYTSSNRSLVQNPAFYGGLPLWQLVQQNDMKSASFFWPGSETKIAGSYPDYWKRYDGKISNAARIDTVMHWFGLPESERPRFISLYFSMTDDSGHNFGPFSPETRQAVMQADSVLGIIMKDLQQIKLPVNVIVVSDHGMVEIKPEADKLLAEEDLLSGIDTSKVITTLSGTHMRFYCKDSTYKKQLYQILKSKEKHFKVYKREELPLRWHSRDNKRVGDIIVVMQPGYDIVSQKDKSKILKYGRPFGNHGYDPATKAVQGIFYAQGPAILSGKKIPSFENVNVYPFIAELLGITNYPAIDGNKEKLEPYIRK